MSDCNRELFFDLVKGFAGIILAVVLFFVGAMGIVERVDWISKSTEIAQLRIDSANVSSKSAEDIAGQATQFNQVIRTKQRWRKVWLVGLLIPAGWDDIKTIEMPTGEGAK